MQIKALHIRLSKEHFQADQDALNEFLSTVAVKKTATQFVTGQPQSYWSILVFYEDQKPEKPDQIEEKDLTEEEKVVFETLKLWSQHKAEELQVLNFLVCHNSELMRLARDKPRSLEELSRIRGFGDRKIARFGEEIIAVLNAVT